MLFPTPKPPQPRRIVVTGAGIITAFGAGWKINPEGFRSGRRAFRPVTLFDVSRQRCKIAAEIDLPGELPPNRLSQRICGGSSGPRACSFWPGAEAWDQSGWTRDGRLPLVLGTTSGEMCLGQEYLHQALRSPFCFKRQAERVTHYLVQQQGVNLANALGIEGEVITLSNACASGANAIGHAWELVRAGRANRVLTGGYDALCHLTFAGFDTLQALSPTAVPPI